MLSRTDADNRRVMCAWIKSRRQYAVGLRRPEPDETPLSPAEVLFGVQRGLLPSIARLRAS